MFYYCPHNAYQLTVLHIRLYATSATENNLDSHVPWIELISRTWRSAVSGVDLPPELYEDAPTR